MGIFTWLGSLFDQLVEWLGKAVVVFINALINVLKLLWEAVVVAALIAAFGLVATLYVIFYAGNVIGETIMEVWDPIYANTKPSEVFVLEQAPQNSPLPKNRSEAKKLSLTNWSS